MPGGSGAVVRLLGGKVEIAAGSRLFIDYSRMDGGTEKVWGGPLAGTGDLIQTQYPGHPEHGVPLLTHFLRIVK